MSPPRNSVNVGGMVRNAPSAVKPDSLAWTARARVIQSRKHPNGTRRLMSWIAPVTLRSPRVTLEPLDQRHCDELIEAVKDGALWTLWYTSIPEPEKMRAEIDRRLALQEAG